MSTPPETDTTTDPDAHATRRMLSLIISAAIVVLVVVGGTIAILITRHDNTEPAAAAPPAAAPTQTDRADWGTPYLDPIGRRVETPPNPNGVALPQDEPQRPPRGGLDHCPATAQDTAGTAFCTSPPAGVMWQQVDTVPMPFSTSDGPTAIDGEIPTGFAQTPQGAALAAQQLIARLVATKDAAIAITEQRVVFDDPTERQARLDRYAKTTDWPPIPLDRIEAYRVAYWAPDYAAIEIASRPYNNDTAGEWTTGRLDLLWRDGDWQLKAGQIPGVPSGGTTMNLTGWTEWPGK
ncbi:hypothetical protein OG921_04855 [Aldersonia sp. NBC_00410]|uniref:hypothetical protein n=1 Tax=Aldersonia sp. NBC_00410 TaxID=2975954 RepID=UPI002250E958|nr:hypothetical protein [Aldersonia sp. NBC_00410]MCX5042501.1 hypothetical protein [Aldersonia sp. NBC_00410]